MQSPGVTQAGVRTLVSYFLCVPLGVSRPKSRVRRERCLHAVEGKGPSTVSFSWQLEVLVQFL